MRGASNWLSPWLNRAHVRCLREHHTIMADKHWHLISYDIRDAKRLRHVARKLEGYGERVQYSVFRCRLNNLALEKLHWELNQLMGDEDDLLVIPLCDCCAGKVPIHSTGDQSSWAAPPPTFRIV